MKYIVKNCPACMEVIETDCAHTYCCTDNHNAYCKNVPDCLLKRIVELCKDVKEKDPIVAERDKQTGEIISIGGWIENPVHDFAQKILQVLEIEEVNE